MYSLALIHLCGMPAFANSTNFQHPTKFVHLRTVHLRTVHLRTTHVRPPRVRLSHFHFKFGKFPPPPTPPPGSPVGPTVDVTQYGASGDAKTDNYQAIQRALAAAPNGTLFFPAGTYLTSGPTVLYNQSVTGVGASSAIVGTFKDSGFKTGVLMPQGNCTISNLSINTAGSALGANQAVLVLNTVGPVTINQVQMVGNFYNNVMVRNSSNVTISNCLLANTSTNQFGPGVILLSNSSTILIANNTFSPLSAWTGIISSFPLLNNSPTTNVTISGNNFQSLSVGDQIGMTYVSGLNITGNTFSYPQYQGTQPAYQGTPISINLGGTAASISSGPIINAQITNNNFVNMQPVSFPAGTIGVVTITGQGPYNVQNVVVNGNAFSQYAVTGWNCSISVGVALTGGAGSIQNFSASGNTMTGTCYGGFFIDSANNVSLNGNTLSNCYGPGIYTGTNNGSSLYIANNVLTNCGLAPPTSPVVKNLGCSLLGSIVMNAAPNVISCSITNNSYGTASEANNLQYDIYCALPHTITSETGNIDQTGLPNFGPI